MLRVEARSGDGLRAPAPELAQLRIEVFRDWPYLYDGDLAYERSYISCFLMRPTTLRSAPLMATRSSGHRRHPRSQPACGYSSQPFLAAGEPLERIFYFGESVLKERLSRARARPCIFRRARGSRGNARLPKTAFCGVVRPHDHPLRPSGYEPLDPFWRKRGYRPLTGMIAHFRGSTWATPRTAKSRCSSGAAISS